MLNIEWLEIPAGRFVYGLTESQREAVRLRAQIEAGFEHLPAKIQQLLTEEAKKFKSQENSIRASFGDIAKHHYSPSPEILSLRRQSQGVDDLLTIERVLARMPPAMTREVKTFYMARFPITTLQMSEFYHRFGHRGMKRSTNYSSQREIQNLPESVGTYVAEYFCSWIGGKLPTALEWEYAARGPESLLYPWGNEWNPLKGNFADSNGVLPRPEHLKGYRFTPVDAYPEGASPFGVYDMVGNMPEFTSMTSEQGGLHIRGMSMKNRTFSPAWFFYIPLFGPSIPWYTAFRPVQNKWHRTVWPGFEREQYEY